MRPSERRRNGRSIYATGNEKRQWWGAPADTVNRELYSWTANLEQLAWPRRYRSLLFFRYMTGRPVNPAFHYSMGPRPGSITALYSRVQWAAPSMNVLAQCDDVLRNRVYSQRPFLQWCPDAGDHKGRVNSKKLTRWTDGAFHDYDVWKLVEACGDDSRMYGAGWLKVDASLNGKEIRCTRIIDDEVMEDETELNVTDLPKTRAIRIFVSRDEMLQQYGADADAAAAIKNAPHVNPGLYFGADLDTSDVITLIEGWRLKVGDQRGRHVLCTANYTFVDEPYDKDHYPMARLVYQEVPSSRPMGMAEQVLSLQREIERVMAAFQENVMRMSWPRVGVEASSNVNDSALAGKSGGIFRFTKTAPVFFNPVAITKDQFEYLTTLIRMVKERIGISDQAAVGMQTAFKSGLAIEKAAQLDDVRHRVLSKHLEDFVEEIGVLLVEAAVKVRPTVRLPGRFVQEIKWNEIGIDDVTDMSRPRAFPMSSLPQTMAYRQEVVDTWFANGQISKQTKMRLDQIPDLDGYQDIANASQESTERQCDEIVEDGTYSPPTVFGDLDDHLSYAQSRYEFECNAQTPQDRLDMLLQYIAAVKELIDERQTAMTPPAPAPGFGVQPPAGAPGNPQVPVNLPAPPVALPPGT
jgi:hypothetical protein